MMIRDFTTKKVGTICEGAEIQVCPKCGRNGKYEVRGVSKKHPEWKPYESWTHKAEVDNICGIGFDVILEHCGRQK